MTTQDTPNQAQTPAAAAAAAADRTWWDRIEPRVLNVMLVVIVASSMVVTGYQSWRMQPQLGASSWWDGALSVSLLTLLPPYVAYYTAKYWQGRGLPRHRRLPAGPPHVRPVQRRSHPHRDPRAGPDQPGPARPRARPPRLVGPDIVPAPQPSGHAAAPSAWLVGGAAVVRW
jgi:hypothetical protein